MGLKQFLWRLYASSYSLLVAFALTAGLLATVDIEESSRFSFFVGFILSGVSMSVGLSSVSILSKWKSGDLFHQPSVYTARIGVGMAVVGSVCAILSFHFLLLPLFGDTVVRMFLIVEFFAIQTVVAVAGVHWIGILLSFTKKSGE